MRGTLPALLAAFALAVVPVQATPILGQLDDFQAGLDNWENGPAPDPTHTLGGGPAGAGDNYMEVVATGGAGQGSKLAAFNTTQWSGDYTANGVTAVEVDMKIFAGPSLDMRVFLTGIPGGDFTSLVSQPLPADGQWHTLTFDVSAGGLTAVGGTNINDALSNAFRLLIRHQPGAPAGIGGAPSVVATVGFDNVRAIPEPATLALLAMGGFVLARRRRR